MQRGYRGSDFSFVVDSSFNPFSFQELMQPWAIYKDAYEQLENSYSELQQKANVWDGMADEQRDPNAYKQYKKYADDLRVQAEDLAHNGLNMNNRRNLIDLKRRYSAEITPIEQAYANRKAQVDEQRKALLQNPTLLLSRRADRTSLDEYMKNPTLGYDSYSGALLAKQVNDAASNISKSLVDYIGGKPLDSNTKTWLQKHGLTAKEVSQAISNPQSINSSKVLSTLMASIIESSGIKEWADPSVLKQAYLYASQGLWNAIGEDKVSTYKPSSSVAASPSPAKIEVPALGPSSLIPNPNSSNTPVSGNKSASSGNGRRRYKYALGGNLYLMGGPDGEIHEKVTISPRLGQMLDQMNDSTYNAFISEQAGTPDYTDEQEDSVLQAYNTKIIDAAREQYLNGLLSETLSDVSQTTPAYAPRPVLTTIEAAQRIKDAEMWKKYGQYFYRTPNGNYAINAKGRQLYKNTPYIYRGPYSVALNPKETEFKEWIDRHGWTDMANNKFGPAQSAKVQDMLDMIERKVDANKATEYYKGMVHTDYPELLSRLNFLSDDKGEIPSYERVKDGKSYTFKEGRDKVNVSKLQTGDIKSAHVVYGVHGNYIEMRIKDGKRLIIPYEFIDAHKDQDVKASVDYAHGLLGLQKQGVPVVYKINKETGKKEGVENIETAITRALNSAWLNMFSTFNTAKSKPDEVVSGTYSSK